MSNVGYLHRPTLFRAPFDVFDVTDEFLSESQYFSSLALIGVRYLRSNKDPGMKAEIDRLNVELAKMPARWRFGVRLSPLPEQAPDVGAVVGE